MRRLLALLLPLAVVAPAAGAFVPPAAQAAPPELRTLTALRVSRSAAPAVVDSHDRQVLLRGVNVNQLNDYFQGNPELATTVPLTADDFAGIAALGFNSVRLTVNWSALEPAHDGIDREYLARVGEAVGWAADEGLYVVLDMHQDAWGKHIATPPGERCVPGSEPAIGWDGAPRWATFTDGMPTCRLEARELSSAVAQAFSSFYADRDGIQSELVELWGLLARTFADEPAVAGYDLLNEPHPGWTPAVTDVSLLGRFYDAAIDAIREAENATPGGFHHIIFFEPGISRAVTGQPSPQPGFTDDDQIVFAPHNYAESIQAVQGVGQSIEQAFANDAVTARIHGTTFWVGEWGFFGHPPSQRDELERFAAQEDAYLVGSAWWVWKQACGDPHVVGTTGNTPTGISPSLVRYDCPEGEPLGIPPDFATVLSRPYPRAAPGRLISVESDPERGEVAVVGETAATGELDLWVPDRGHGAPLVSGGHGPVRVIRVPGGYRALVPVEGRYDVRAVLR